MTKRKITFIQGLLEKQQAIFLPSGLFVPLPSDPTARQKALVDVSQKVECLIAQKQTLSHEVSLDVLQVGYFDKPRVEQGQNTDLAFLQSVLVAFQALHVRLYQHSLSSGNSLSSVIKLGEQYITELNHLIKQNDQIQENNRG